MDAKTCPLDGDEMTTTIRGGVPVAQCVTCGGIFLEHADLGVLIEQENEWHLSSGPTTQPIPRIVPGMSPPPASLMPKHARAYLDELFG